MKSPRPDFRPGADAITAEATRWVMRLDRGLSPAEQDAYLLWLAADPRHAKAMARLLRTWESFDRLAGLQSAVEAVPDPDLLQPRPNGWARHRRRVAWAAMPLLAAGLALLFALRHGVPTGTHAPLTATVGEFVALAPIEERTLEDGSVLRLNRGAVVTVDYTAGERRLRLERGEASFKVTKDSTRPFVVMTTSVDVRALGTEFNVQLGDRAIDIIVTEGTVALVPAAGPPTDASAPTVGAGQRALVPIEPAVGLATVSTPPPEELSRRLAWQPRLLSFNDEPLSVILGEFNRHNPVTLRLDDPALQDLRLSARFRSDNVQGFLRLLESEFRVRSVAQANGEVVLRSAESFRAPKARR